MVWQEGLKEHGHQRVSSNVSVSRFVQACKKYCTSLLFNPQIIDYLSVQFVKKNQGVHNVDFSGVHDDKCHTRVGQSRVTNLTSWSAPIVYIK